MRFNVYFRSGENQIFDAEDIEVRDGATVLTALVNGTAQIVAWFPPDAVRYIKTYPEPVTITPAPPLVPAAPMPVPRDDGVHPLSYTITQASQLIGAGKETIRARIGSGVYEGAWKDEHAGVRGPPPWMIPLESLGLAYTPEVSR